MLLTENFALTVMATIHIHFVKNSSLDILINISFCISLEKHPTGSNQCEGEWNMTEVLFLGEVFY